MVMEEAVVAVDMVETLDLLVLMLEQAAVVVDLVDMGVEITLLHMDRALVGYHLGIPMVTVLLVLVQAALQVLVLEVKVVASREAHLEVL